MGLQLGLAGSSLNLVKGPLEMIVRDGPKLHFHQALSLGQTWYNQGRGSMTSVKWCFWGVGRRKRRRRKPWGGCGVGPCHSWATRTGPFQSVTCLLQLAMADGFPDEGLGTHSFSWKTAVNVLKLMWTIDTKTYRVCKMNWGSAHKVSFSSFGVISHEPMKGLHKTVKMEILHRNRRRQFFISFCFTCLLFMWTCDLINVTELDMDFNFNLPFRMSSHVWFQRLTRSLQ